MGVSATRCRLRDQPSRGGASFWDRSSDRVEDAGVFRAAWLPAETTEAFCAAHVAAFAFFGGVPLSILYDNTKLAVARILGDGRRQRPRVFSELEPV